MFVRALRAKYHAQYLLLLLLVILLRIDGWLMLYGKEWFLNNSDVVFSAPFLQKNPEVISLIISLVVFLTGLLLNHVLENNRIIPLNQLLPAAIYALMMSSSVTLLPAMKMAIVNLLFIFQLNILFNMYGELSPRKKVFDFALLLGLTSLMYPPVAWFLLFLWFSLAIYQVLSIRLIIISILGFIVPFIYSGFYYFWIGKLREKVAGMAVQLTDLPSIQFEINIYIAILWGFFFLLFLSGYGEIIRTMIQNPIEIRRKIRIVILFLFFAVVTTVFSGEMFRFHLMIGLIPLSSLLSVYLTQTRRLTRAEVLVSLILITIFSEKLVRWLM